MLLPTIVSHTVRRNRLKRAKLAQELACSGVKFWKKSGLKNVLQRELHDSRFLNAGDPAEVRNVDPVADAMRPGVIGVQIHAGEVATDRGQQADWRGNPWFLEGSILADYRRPQLDCASQEIADRQSSAFIINSYGVQYVHSLSRSAGRSTPLFTKERHRATSTPV